jgi:hypothetical protein
MHGEDHPGIISVFQSRLVSALKWTGGSAFSGAIPEALGPRNWSQCMESEWNLYRSFDPVSQEPRPKITAISTVENSKEGLVDKLKLKRRSECFLFMIAGIRYAYSIYKHYDIKSIINYQTNQDLELK